VLDASFGREFSGFAGSFVHKANDREASFFIGGQMSCSNDTSSADDDDGPKMLWTRQLRFLNGCEEACVTLFVVWCGGGHVSGSVKVCVVIIFKR